MHSASIKTACLDDIRQLLEWARVEGWNPGLDDAAVFHQADSSGFFIARYAGEPVAGVSVVVQNSDHAFLGLYICRPEWRGRGHGMAVWHAGLDYAGSRTIGLDGVPAQQENYRRSGFVYLYANLRFSGILATEQFADSAQSHDLVRQADSSDLQAVVSLDRAIGGVERTGFYRSWLAPSATRQTFVLDKMSGNDEPTPDVGTINSGTSDYGQSRQSLAGMVTVRRCVTGYKIGPLLAEDVLTAQCLLNKAAAMTGNHHVMIDIPEPNEQARQLMSQMNFNAIFETARMYRGSIPKIDTDRLFGVATLELG